MHLAGEDIAQRWNDDALRRIRESRELGTRNLVAGLRAAEPRPGALISASAVGYYGHRPEPIDEDAPPGDDVLADVCVAWEREAQEAEPLGVRVVRVRTGVVLDRHGGALQKMLLPFRLGVGGPVAGGRQPLPWIHVDDVVGIYLRAIDDDRWSGAVNATAPHPVTNREFSRALGRALHRPAFAPVPASRSGRCTAGWPSSSSRARTRSRAGRWSSGTRTGTRISTRRCGPRSTRLDHRPGVTGNVRAMPPNARSDRYEPLPGIARDPGLPVSQARRPAAAGSAQLVAVALVVALAAGIVFGLPAITTTKEERAAAERSAVAKRRAERLAQLQAEVRLLRGRGTPARGLEGAAALTARHALAGELAAAVQQDAVARVQAGEFTQSVHRVECERFPRAVDGADPADDLASRHRPLLLPGDHRRRAEDREQRGAAASATRTARWSTSPAGASRTAR